MPPKNKTREKPATQRYATQRNFHEKRKPQNTEFIGVQESEGEKGLTMSFSFLQKAGFGLGGRVEANLTYQKPTLRLYSIFCLSCLSIILPVSLSGWISSAFLGGVEMACVASTTTSRCGGGWLCPQRLFFSFSPPPPLFFYLSSSALFDTFLFSTFFIIIVIALRAPSSAPRCCPFTNREREQHCGTIGASNERNCYNAIEREYLT